MDQQQDQMQTPVPADYYDTLISEMVGYGQAQEKLTRSLYLLLFALGCETAVLGLLLPLLSR